MSITAKQAGSVAHMETIDVAKKMYSATFEVTDENGETMYTDLVTVKPEYADLIADVSTSDDTDESLRNAHIQGGSNNHTPPSVLHRGTGQRDNRVPSNCEHI